MGLSCHEVGKADVRLAGAGVFIGEGVMVGIEVDVNRAQSPGRNHSRYSGFSRK
jgi:hypothetical protein